MSVKKDVSATRASQKQSGDQEYDVSTRSGREGGRWVFGVCILGGRGFSFPCALMIY